MDDSIQKEFDKLHKQIDMLFADRDILTDVVGRLASVEEQLKLNFKHDNEIRKDLKEEISISNDRVVAKVETKIDEIKGKVSGKIKDGLFKKIFNI